VVVIVRRKDGWVCMILVIDDRIVL
jgi:hypothetical protein